MPKKTTKQEYKASLKIANQWFYSKGKTIEEVILNLKPNINKGVAVLTLERGDKKQEKILPRGTTIRLFGEVSRMGKEIAIKNVLQLFNL